MVARIDDHRVRGAEDRPQRADVRLMAGGEDNRVLSAHPLGELALKLDVEIDRAVEEARAGEAGAVAVERIERTLFDALVAGQPQVVVRAKHHPALALHLDDGEGGALEHVKVGHGIDLAGGSQLLETLVLSSLRKNIDRGHPETHRTKSSDGAAG